MFRSDTWPYGVHCRSRLARYAKSPRTYFPDTAYSAGISQNESAAQAVPVGKGESEPVKVEVEDGLYRAQSGDLHKLDVEDDGLKKIRVSQEAFEAVREVQKAMRRLLGGHKPDINLVAEAMLMTAAQIDGLEEKVREHAVRVYAGLQN